MPEVLLAEDNPADVRLIRTALEEHQVTCTVRLASDGEQMLQMIAAEIKPDERPLPDLIILDLNLPRHNGIEVLERLRAAARWCDVPVVVLTTSDSPRDRSQATRLGVAQFLRKPFNLDEFLGLGAIFRSLLEQKRATQA